jgi:hypothetical protein
VNGFPADVFAASTATDVELVQKAGLITTTGSRIRTGRSWRHRSWDSGAAGAKNIHNWND